MRNRLRTFGAAALLAALTALAYSPAMRGDFIWDDREMTVDNTLVKSPSGLREIWLGRSLPEYHPLTYSVFWLEWRCWGTNPAGYHVVNILLHAAGVALLWLVLRDLRVPGCWLAALLFGLHPVCVGTVAWIAELKNTLSFCCFLLSILCYLRAARAPDPAVRAWRAAALAALALALLSKISAVALPPVLLLLAWWREGRITRRELARVTPFFLLAAAAGLWGMSFQGRYTGLSESLGLRLLAGSRAVWFYLSKLFCPTGLTIVYPRWQLHPSEATAWLPAAMLAVALGLFWRFRASWGRAGLLGMGYFLIALAPVLGFFKLVFFDFSQVADHLQYLAAPGIVALAVAAARQWLSSRVWLWRCLAATAALALGVLTWRHEADYANMRALWTQNLACNPNSFDALLYLGGEAERARQFPEAERYFRRVLELNADSVEGNYNMAVLLDDEGRPDEAIACLEKTLRLRPEQASAHLLLAWCLDEKQREGEAETHLREAIRLAPQDFRVYQNLGNLLAKTSRLDEAVAEFGRALKLAPDNAALYVGLGFAQARRGETAAARACFSKALSLDPANADAQRGLRSLPPVSTSSSGSPAQ